MFTPARSAGQGYVMGERELSAKLHSMADDCSDCNVTRDDYEIRFCPLHAAAHDLLSACQDIKAFLNGLENTTLEDGRLRVIRRRVHAPLHAKLDAAISKATAAS